MLKKAVVKDYSLLMAFIEETNKNLIKSYSENQLAPHLSVYKP